MSLELSRGVVPGGQPLQGFAAAATFAARVPFGSWTKKRGGLVRKVVRIDSKAKEQKSSQQFTTMR